MLFIVSWVEEQEKGRLLREKLPSSKKGKIDGMADKTAEN
jgi:hypothetical protein